MSDSIIRGSFIMPVSVEKTAIYPWEDINLNVFAKKLFLVAQKNGYQGSWENFKQSLLDLQSGKPISDNFQEYLGSYNVVPMAEMAQILPTNGTVLLADITVEPIPYYETSNDKGGYTVYIGE